MSKVTNKIIEILGFIPDKDKLKILDEKHALLTTQDGRELLDISPAGITIPGVPVTDRLFKSPSPLADSFVPNNQLEYFFTYLATNQLFHRLNHLGICYLVDSVREEKATLTREIKKTDLHLYEEPANDESAWLFAGDAANWQDPLVEVILVEQTSDQWKDYWLPHFQIDIDTHLDGDEIENLIKKVFKGQVKPYRLIETGQFIVLVRARLGIVSGVNISLDIGFEGRMTRYHRTKLLTQLV